MYVGIKKYSDRQLKWREAVSHPCVKSANTSTSLHLVDGSWSNCQYLPYSNAQCPVLSFCVGFKEIWHLSSCSANSHACIESYSRATWSFHFISYFLRLSWAFEAVQNALSLKSGKTNPTTIAYSTFSLSVLFHGFVKIHIFDNDLLCFWASRAFMIPKSLKSIWQL